MTDYLAIQERLNCDPDYRRAFFRDPAATLRSAGVVASEEKERALAGFARQALAVAARDQVTRSRSTPPSPADLDTRAGADS